MSDIPNQDGQPCCICNKIGCEHLTVQKRRPERFVDTLPPLPCAGKGRDDEPCTGEVEERQSLDIYAGRWCNSHWKTSGYRDESASAFDPADAGESYEDDY